MTQGYRYAPPLAMYGALIALLGLVLFVLTSVLALPVRLVGLDSHALLQPVVWAAGAPVVGGIVLILIDVAFLSRLRRGDSGLMDDPILDPRITVALTAYNDEESIGDSVLDFLGHPLVTRVLVVDNNSSDRTRAVAESAGASVVTEVRQGYGYCAFRALTEGSRHEDTEIVALCEGDMTFRSADLDKLVAYIAHGDVVNGTRIVEQLRSPQTQLTTFMYWGNFAGGKLLELKNLGRGTISDLGTTYKLCRSDYLRMNLSRFNPRVNLEFNAHFLDVVLRGNDRLIEAPITFYPRVGESKGGNVSNARAAKVGLRMLAGMVLGWSILTIGKND